jgi:hypothetical protein
MSPGSSRLLGTYLLGGEPLVVAEHEGGLRVTAPGVPDEFAAPLVPHGGVFHVVGGPLAATDVLFDAGDPCPGGVVAGVVPFLRAPADATIPSGRGLVPPPLDLSPEEEQRFAELLAEIHANPDGDRLEVGDGPRWRFVEWLTRRDAVIFHGSPKPDIDQFAPLRTSIELMDHAGTGNLAAVYGTPFGLWAMWFAVLDRSQLEGSIRNGALRWTSGDGRTLDVYHFSVHHEHVGGDIWRPGTLYLLPRETFHANPLFPGGSAASEWASLEAVRPLKRIAVDPDDFPFREQVGGHDDSLVIEAARLGDIVLAKATSAGRIDGGLAIELAWDEELEAVSATYLDTTRALMPDVEMRFVDRHPAGRALELCGADGLLQALEARLRRRGIELDG